AFRMQKETIKATYTAAEAQSRIGEAVSGISEEMGDVGMAVQRGQDKTAQMEARAGAVDEPMASGAAGGVTGTPGDAIQAELDSMRGGQDIELELQRLRGEIGAGDKQAIEGNTPAPDGAARPAAAEQPQAGDGTGSFGSWARGSLRLTMWPLRNSTAWTRVWTSA